MKNLFFILVLAIGLMSFTSSNEEVKDLNFINSMQIENLQGEDYPCRWRTCTYVNGVLQGCTAWTYGECLDEVTITASLSAKK